MYELTVEREFCAAHALTVGSVREATHGHNWRVTVTIAGTELDRDGLLCDFHTVEGVLDEIIAPLNNADLNGAREFAGINPTAEHVARHIATGMAERLNGALSPHAWVESARVTEAPGCAATYRASRGGPRGGRAS